MKEHPLECPNNTSISLKKWMTSQIITPIFNTNLLELVVQFPLTTFNVLL